MIQDHEAVTPLPTADCRLPRRGRWSTPLALAFLGAVGALILPRPVFADPHAVFYTDRGQEQVFFNVLAALNQADYVEDPGRPPIQSNQRLGQLIRSGTVFFPPTPSPQLIVRRNAQGQIEAIQRTPPLEPSEVSADTRLPRIRVRQVTSDDGDVYFRERIERRAHSEELRLILGFIACRAADQILGPETAGTQRNCPENALATIFSSTL